MNVARSVWGWAFVLVAGAGATVVLLNRPLAVEPQGQPSSAPSPSSVASPPQPSIPPADSPTPSEPVLGLVIPTAPTGPLLSGAPLSDTDDDGVFRLTIHSDQDRYRAGQLIEIGATLTFLGPGETIQALGSGSGLAGYGLRLEGSSLAMGAAFTTDCAPYAFTRDMPISYPFTKSGGFGDYDPFKAFYESYFSSPDLRLPAGTWTITAGAGFGTGADCWSSFASGYDLALVGARFLANDLNADGRDDLAAFYFGSTQRINVWLSTGTGLSYQGTNGWWSSPGYDLSQVSGRFLSGKLSGQ